MSKMKLTQAEKKILRGADGKSTQKAMEILVALGAIYNAERMVPVSSVQVAGVSYDNLGEAGLQYLSEMADGGGRARVLTTLNPAGMDVENWQALQIDPDFAIQQIRVIQAFERMNILTTCTCTPYLIGNLPCFGDHIAWSESSAVCFANSILGARTNREGGPSALASSLTGVTPEYGYHLDENRHPNLSIHVNGFLKESYEFGALGLVIGEKIETWNKKPVLYITGIRNTTIENLKSFCASIATYAGITLFHIPGITPEASCQQIPGEALTIEQGELEKAIKKLNEASSDEIDFVSLGCPHLTIQEIARIAKLLKGKKIRKTFWITTARPTKQIADRAGYTQIIEEAGALFAVDTCCVVAPIKGRFQVLATDSAKACYYASAKNKFRTVFKSFDQVVQEALT